MTEQYGQPNINRSLARRVSRDDIDSSLTVPAVVLTADDQFVFITNGSTTGAFQVNLPDVRVVPGRQIDFKVDAMLFFANTPISISVLEGSGQTIEGGTPTLIPGGNNIFCVRAVPGSNEWALIQSPVSP